MLYLALIEDHNNDDEFIRIYYKYRLEMFKIANYYTKDFYYAEDAVHNAFIGIAKRIQKIRELDEERIKIYVMVCAKHAAINLLKKNNVQVIDIEEVCDLKSSERVEEKVQQSEAVKEIKAFIKTMEPKYRDVLSFHFLNDLSLREISEILNEPLSTIKTRFYKAKSILAEKFKEAYVE